MEFQNRTDCQNVMAGVVASGAFTIAPCVQRLPEDFLDKQQITTWLVEWTANGGLTHTSQTYLTYDSCNDKAKALVDEGMTVTKWCLVQ